MDKMNKEMGALDIFSLASGAMISSGLFVLPGLLFGYAGPSVILVYMLASLLVLPAALSQAELASAMPKAGGSYFFIARSLGSASGLFSGLADWFSVSLKSSFALVGMASFMEIALFRGDPVTEEAGQRIVKLLACGGCLLFAFINTFGSKHVGRLQSWLVAVLLGSLLFFVFAGLRNVSVLRFEPFFKEDMSLLKLLSVTGMVFVSYGGFTKVVSVSEEVRNPVRNIPLGMFAAWLVVSMLYLAVVGVTVGVMDAEQLSGSLTPISSAASSFMGTGGTTIIAIAALTAFITTANAGIMAASRSLLAMSRDKLLPGALSTLSKKHRVPVVAIVVTALFMMLTILLLDINVLVKTASTLMIILFALVNAGVLVMRMSKMQSYRPAFGWSGYPYVQIFALIVYAALIFSMGTIPLIISGAFVLASATWYFAFISKRVSQQSAVMHVVKRITNKQFDSAELEDELREILIERDEIIADRFDHLIKECHILDIDSCGHLELFHKIADDFASSLDTSSESFFIKLCEREMQSSTVIGQGIAVPHIVIEGEKKFDIMMVRSRGGVEFLSSNEPVHCVFVLAGTKDERNYHLRALMAIAQIAQQKGFMDSWQLASDENQLRNLILLSKRTRE
ncbi:MAG: amino acid permease [Phycisphaerae bacterium]